MAPIEQRATRPVRRSGAGRRALVVLVLVALVAAACGRSDDATTPTSAAMPEEPSDRASRAVVAMERRWGEEGAFVVVLSAYDQGFSADQVVNAALSDTLAADGVVLGVPPTRDPEGLLSESGGGDEQSLTAPARSTAPGVAAPGVAAGWGARTADDDVPQDRYIGSVDEDVSAVFARLRSQTQAAEAAAWEADEPFDRFRFRVTLVMVELGQQGYSAAQIIDAIVLGDIVKTSMPQDLSICMWTIRSGSGRLEPAFPAAKGLECEVSGEYELPAGGDADDVVDGSDERSEGPPRSDSSSTTTAPVGIPLPRTYRGQGSITATTSFASGSCRTEGSQLEITLLPDGTLVGTFTPDVPLVEGYVQRGQGFELGGCGASGGVVAHAVVGDHTPPSADLPGRVRVRYPDRPDMGVVLEGDVTADQVRIDWRYERAMTEFSNPAVADPVAFSHYDLVLTPG